MKLESKSPPRIDISSRGKTEVISIRLNAKAKFGLELLARLQHRTVAQTVEMAIDGLLTGEHERTFVDKNGDNIKTLVEKLWSPHRGARLLKMMLDYHNLLSPEEELLWNNMARAGLLDRFFVNPASHDREPIPDQFNQTLVEDAIARYWDEQDQNNFESGKRKK